MDSTGLKVLLVVQRSAAARRRLAWRWPAPTRSVRRIVTLTGLRPDPRDLVDSVDAVDGADPRSETPSRPTGCVLPPPGPAPMTEVSGGANAQRRIVSMRSPAAVGRGLGGERSAAGLPQLGVDGAVRLPGAVVPGGRPAR